ncbi:MAG: lipocalin family protein [Prolixibacteraceae bacterium]|nr:lipocalin family protein [Prolixibacteraceae bacterium]
MKKLFVCLMVCFSFSVLFNSCQQDEAFFQESFLIGKWVSGTVYYKYLSDYTGSTWDTKDNVKEEEAQPFTWTLVKSELTHIHIMEMGGNIPKVYTVTELTATTLKYKDAFDKTFSFTKM